MLLAGMTQKTRWSSTKIQMTNRSAPYEMQRRGRQNSAVADYRSMDRNVFDKNTDITSVTVIHENYVLVYCQILYSCSMMSLHLWLLPTRCRDYSSIMSDVANLTMSPYQNSLSLFLWTCWALRYFWHTLYVSLHRSSGDRKRNVEQ